MSYTIRQVATQFHMQPSTLRYYEDQGLLTNVGAPKPASAYTKTAISTVCARFAASRTPA